MVSISQRGHQSKRREWREGKASQLWTDPPQEGGVDLENSLTKQNKSQVCIPSFTTFIFNWRCFFAFIQNSSFWGHDAVCQEWSSQAKNSMFVLSSWVDGVAVKGQPNTGHSFDLMICNFMLRILIFLNLGKQASFQRNNLVFQAMGINIYGYRKSRQAMVQKKTAEKAPVFFYQTSTPQRTWRATLTWTRCFHGNRTVKRRKHPVNLHVCHPENSC